MAYTPPATYLIDPARVFPDVTQRLNEFRDMWLVKHQLPDEKLLYHYTDLDGLRGILKTRSFWCGHHSTFNDPMEIQYGKKLISDLISERKEDEENPNIKEFYKSASLYVNAFGLSIHHAFISCFCEDGDLLSQWREYSDNGGGYCLGLEFSNQTMIETKTDNIPSDNKIKLRKVIYKREEQEELINNLLDLALNGLREVFNKIPAEQHNYTASSIGGEVSNLLIDLMLAFKHEAFDSEQEWRLVIVFRDNFEAEDLKFRESQTRIIPYRECFVYNRNGDDLIFPINKVRYGPSADQSQVKSTLQLYLNYMATTDHECNIQIPNVIEINEPRFVLRG